MSAAVFNACDRGISFSALHNSDPSPASAEAPEGLRRGRSESSVNDFASNQLGSSIQNLSPQELSGILPSQEGEIGTVSQLGPLCGTAIDTVNGDTVEVPGWLTRLFHPPEM